MKKPIVFLIFVTLLLLFISCAKNEEIASDQNSITLNLPEEYFNYSNIQLPSHFTTNGFPQQLQFQYAPIEVDNTPAENQITDAGATLGRVLFYDKNLSANGTVSCASCHKAEHGFSDPNIFSEGFNGEFTRRHSMSIVNARYYAEGKFFWDERASTLEEQVLMPFQDEIEMGLTLQELINIVNTQSYYSPLFREAFGDDTVTSERISKALAQFIRSLVSTTSKYDLARSEVQSPLVDFPGFTELENEGKRIFYSPRQLTNGLTGNCVSCHSSEAFLSPIPNNPNGPTTFATTNGLDAVSIDDLGINESTGNPRDIGKFKVPSLKNIAIRPPYMHDGRFSNLPQVIEHYSSGIQNHPNLISPLINSAGEVGQFNFTPAEKDALIAFLNTLTDNQMLADEKFSNPFE